MEQVDIFQNTIIFLKMSFPKGCDHFFHLEEQMFVHPKSEGLHPLSTDTDNNPPFTVWPLKGYTTKQCAFSFL